MSAVETFEAANQRKIPIDWDHFEFTNRTVGVHYDLSSMHENIVAVSTNVAGGFKALDLEKTDAQAEARERVSLKGYSARFIATRIFVDLLLHTDVTTPFRKSLDIGCGFGLQPRILKGLGLVEETVGIDLYDRATAIDEDALGAVHRKFRLFRFLEPILERIERKPKAKRSELERALLAKVSSPRLHLREAEGYLLPKEIYQDKFVRKPSLDRFIKGDVFELDEKFDLITAFSTMEWFEASKIFPKIAELLEDGGVFYMYVDNWWAGNTIRVPSHFPYAPQRLQREDFHRYSDRLLPKLAREMKAAYDFYDPEHPTFSDYVAIGIANGLVPICYRCDIPTKPFDHRFGVNPLGYARFDHANFRTVLSEIQQFRPDVRAEDLLANTVRIVFRKVDPGARLEKRQFDEALDDLDFQYRPTGFFARNLRKLGIRLLFKSD